MTAGVGLFGTFTAYVASSFLEQEEKEEEKREEEILSELKAIRKELAELKKSHNQWVDFTVTTPVDKVKFMSTESHP